MTFLNNTLAVSKLENTGVSITLGGDIDPFRSVYGGIGFHSTSTYHSTDCSVVDIFAKLTNDSDTNTPLGRISIKNSRIGSALSHKMSVIMLPVSAMTSNTQHLEMTSAVSDTGDLILSNEIDILSFSCRGAI